MIWRWMKSVAGRFHYNPGYRRGFTDGIQNERERVSYILAAWREADSHYRGKTSLALDMTEEEPF